MNSESSALMIIDEIASNTAEPLAHKTSFESKNQMKERLKLELKQVLLAFQRQCTTGLQLILGNTEAFSDFITTLSSAEKRVQDPVQCLEIVKQLINGKTWIEILKLPYTIVQALYDNAKRIFDVGNYTAAEDAFSFLAWLHTKQPEFWLCLGHSQFHLGHHEKALQSYAMASSFDSENTWPYLYSCCCFEALDDKDSAFETIQEGLEIENSKNNPNKVLLLAIQEKIGRLKKPEQTLNT